MFYNSYLDQFYLDELFQNYDINYLKSIDRENFDKVYCIFKKYNFDYIEDIILEYLEIFKMDSKMVETKILLLRKALGDDYINKIGADISYLEYIVKK